MIILGMTGPIGHGKSTFAKAVAQLEPKTIRFESSIIISEVANALQSSTRSIPSRDDIAGINDWLRPLPAILLEVVHVRCNFDQIKLELSEVERHPIEYGKLQLHLENLNRHPALVQNEITPDNKEVYRPLLQWLGGYLIKKVGPEIWHGEIIRRMREKQAEGYEICIVGGLRYPTEATLVRGAHGIILKVYRPGHLQYDMLDPTERERDTIIPDSTIVSNGSVEDVNNCAKKVLEDIRNDSLQKVYYTARAA